MLKIISLFITLILSQAAFAQSFEGKITAHITYKSTSPNIYPEYLALAMGDTSIYYVKDAHRKIEANGRQFEWQIYEPTENRLYTKSPTSDLVQWFDASVNNDEVLNAEITKNTIDILGYKCRELVLTCKSGVQKHYFSSKLPVDAALFKNYKWGNYQEILSRCGAITLKSVIQSEHYIITSTAVKISPQKLDVALFKIPANLQTMQKPQ